MSTSDLGVAAHEFRQKGAKPGTRGPHLKLFSGGAVTKKAAAPELTVSQRVTNFAEVRKLKEDTTRVLSMVIEHHERTGKPMPIDAFDIAKKADVTFERACVIRSELMRANAVRISSGVWGDDGLLPGDAWDFQHGRR